MIGPRPIETVGNCQKSGISQGCGYDDSPGLSCSSWRKLLELLEREPAFEKRARVDARRGVALEIDHVAGMVVGPAAEEMVEADLVQRGGGRVGRNVPADAFLLAVGAHDHRHGIPADDALDAALDLAVAGVGRLFVGRDRVDVGRVGRERHGHARVGGVNLELSQDLLRALGPRPFQQVVERIDPVSKFQDFAVVLHWIRLGHPIFSCVRPAWAQTHGVEVPYRRSG